MARPKPSTTQRITTVLATHGFMDNKLSIPASWISGVADATDYYAIYSYNDTQKVVTFLGYYPRAKIQFRGKVGVGRPFDNVFLWQNTFRDHLPGSSSLSAMETSSVEQKKEEWPMPNITNLERRPKHIHTMKEVEEAVKLRLQALSAPAADNDMFVNLADKKQLVMDTLSWSVALMWCSLRNWSIGNHRVQHIIKEWQYLESRLFQQRLQRTSRIRQMEVRPKTTVLLFFICGK